MSKTIGGILAEYGFGPEEFMRLPDDLQTSMDHWQSWDLGSHCGNECRLILEASESLLGMADPSSHDDLWRGIVRAMAVICMG